MPAVESRKRAERSRAAAPALLEKVRGTEQQALCSTHAPEGAANGQSRRVCAVEWNARRSVRTRAARDDASDEALRVSKVKRK